MHRAQKSGHCAANHNVVEVCNHEISVCEMHVRAEGRQEEARQSAYCKEADESEPIKHWRIEPDLGTVHCGDPVEHLDCAGYGD